MVLIWYGNKGCPMEDSGGMKFAVGYEIGFGSDSGPLSLLLSFGTRYSRKINKVIILDGSISHLYVSPA